MIQTERNIKSMFPEARDIAQLIRELEARDPKFDSPILYKLGLTAHAVSPALSRKRQEERSSR